MRLIDADVLVERWKRIASISWNETAVTSWSHAYEEIISEIEEAPTIEAEPKWILCSERVPKQNEHIIGTFKNINEGSNLVFGVNFYHDLLNEPMPLIAWMPLPPAYQGE